MPKVRARLIADKLSRLQCMGLCIETLNSYMTTGRLGRTGYYIKQYCFSRMIVSE